MSDFDDFKQYYSLAGKLIGELNKEQLAECARMMALHLADYVQRFGHIPRSDLLSLLGSAEINDKQAALLNYGCKCWLGIWPLCGCATGRSLFSFAALVGDDFVAVLDGIVDIRFRLLGDLARFGLEALGEGLRRSYLRFAGEDIGGCCQVTCCDFGCDVLSVTNFLVHGLP